MRLAAWFALLTMVLASGVAACGGTSTGTVAGEPRPTATRAAPAPAATAAGATASPAEPSPAPARLDNLTRVFFVHADW